MFSYEILQDEGIIVLTSTGRHTIHDYQEVAPKFFEDVKSLNIRRILMDNRKFEGWQTKGAPSVTFFSWIESVPLFDKIAVVYHDGIRDEIDKFVEIFRNANKDVRLFRPEQFEAALHWLKAEDEASRPG
jgi:hypothetical protein